MSVIEYSNFGRHKFDKQRSREYFKGKKNLQQKHVPCGILKTKVMLARRGANGIIFKITQKKPEQLTGKP